MKSIMSRNFQTIPEPMVPRSQFLRNSGYKTTLDAGYLVPFFLDEVLPGDSFNCNVSAFARLSTPTYPIMDNMFMDTFFFFVPYRLLWDNFKKFCGEQTDPGDSTDYTVPVINDLQNFSNMTLWDYFGLPSLVNAIYEFSALPARAYNLIYNEWFRSEDLIDSVTINKDDGPDSEADYTLLRRCKKRDYFSSCLPWTQKSDDVLLSLGTEAPIFGDNMDFDDVADAGNYAQVRDAAGSSANLRELGVDATAGGNTPVFGRNVTAGTGELKVDLSQAVSSTVNDLLQAFHVQRMYVKDARSGTRYAEIVQSHFGVTSPDARLQRPEYLGGGTSPVIITPVAQTDTNVGNLAAFGVVGLKNHGFVRNFVEHGLIMGLVNVRADINYQEGIDRMWSRSVRTDFYWPTLRSLGEQAVLNKEIYIDAATIGAGTDEDVFGYQERYACYKYKNSKITGKLRSNDPATLEAWHLAPEFGAQPTLDDTFIVDNPPIDRCIVTPTEPHFIFDSYIRLISGRPMPLYTEPGLIDRF